MCEHSSKALEGLNLQVTVQVLCEIRVSHLDFRETNRTYQNDDPDRVVCKQQQAEDNKTYANCLIHSCSLKAKKHLLS